MKHTHTPGPWSVEVGTLANTGDLFVKGPANGMKHCVCKLMGAYAPDHTDQRHANADLIAAAPDLLSVLERVLQSVPFASYRGDGELDELEQDIRSAIASATGAQS